MAATDPPAMLSVAGDAGRLLAYLLLHRPSPLPRRHAAFALWSDTTEDEALARLRRHLYLLQRLLPPAPADRPWILADRLSVRWNPGCAYWLDVDEFESLCRAPDAPRGDESPRVAIGELERAVALYTDDLLVDRYDDWVLLERERLREMLGRTLLRLLGLHAATGDLRSAAAVADRLVRHDSLVEESHRLAIALRYLDGDRGAALEAFQTCRRVLADELAIEPMPETQRLAEAIRRSAAPDRVLQLVAPDFPPGIDITTVLRRTAPHNLRCRLTTFIGREAEMAAVTELLATQRLVTLIGPGGCGKTRLALEIAARLVEPRPGSVDAEPSPSAIAGGPPLADGIWWVDLAPIEDGSLVPHAVAAAMGIRDDPRLAVTEQLERELRSKALLLLLDNVEHVVDACADLARRILGVAQAVRVLATSREPVGVPGEVTWLVPPLHLPPTAEVRDVADLARYEAPRLFVDRARLCNPRFEVRPAEVPIVAELCRRLDGLPLALELAAAQTRSVGVAEIDARLADRFRLLIGGDRAAPAHHATMRAAIDWSYDLLTEPERVLFRRLAVFRGGWTLAAAEAVCADDALEARYVSVVQGGLVARSLVAVVEGGGARRYRMLQTIREYARDRLGESGTADEVRGRHLSYYLDLARAAARELTGARQAEWLARLDAERPNLDAALRWAHDRGLGEAALCLAGDLGRFWELRGHFAHGRSWLDRVLALPGAGAPTATRANALRAAGSLAEEQGAYDTARDCYRQALAIVRQLDDPAAVAGLLSDLGNVADFQSDYGTARSLHEEALAIRRRLGDARAIAISLNNLGNVAEFQGDYERARDLYQESLHLMRAGSDRWVVSVILNNLGRLAMDQGEHEVAEGQLTESLAIARELGDRQGIAYALHNLGEVARLTGDLGAARRLQCESLATSAELGNSQGVAASFEALAMVAHAQGESGRALSLLAAADAVRARIGAPGTPDEQAKLREVVESLRRELGGLPFERAWAAGRAMSDAQATALALQGTPAG